MSTYNLYRNLLNEKHLLIAGATGSGKSVVLNALIYTVLAQNRGGLVLIDPKKVEFVQWSHCTECLAHATEYEDITQAFQRVQGLLNQRYKLMQRKQQRETTEPHIFVFVDEIAELFAHGTQYRNYIQSIAQIGRAAHVHLIGATQSPTRDIIPSKIKINFDCIVGLRVNFRQDSVNIIRTAGLEQLPKYGSCIVSNSDGLTRWNNLHMYSDADIAALAHEHRKKSFLERLLKR